MSKAEIQQRYFSLYEQLQEYDREIAGGCTAVVALIHKNRLFLANVGDARAILCRQDGATGEIGIVQVKNMSYIISPPRSYLHIKNQQNICETCSGVCWS